MIQGTRKYHWSSWRKLCLPKKERGIGIRRMEEISCTLAMKRWWRFRTVTSLWSQFLNSKYCSRKHSVAKKLASSNSHIWKQMMQVKVKTKFIMENVVSSGIIGQERELWLTSVRLGISLENSRSKTSLTIEPGIRESSIISSISN